MLQQTTQQSSALAGWVPQRCIIPTAGSVTSAQIGCYLVIPAKREGNAMQLVQQQHEKRTCVCECVCDSVKCVNAYECVTVAGCENWQAQRDDVYGCGLASHVVTINWNKLSLIHTRLAHTYVVCALYKAFTLLYYIWYVPCIPCTKVIIVQCTTL